jgi:hypothetical protein
LLPTADALPIVAEKQKKGKEYLELIFMSFVRIDSNPFTVTLHYRQTPFQQKKAPETDQAACGGS